MGWGRLVCNKCVYICGTIPPVFWLYYPNCVLQGAPQGAGAAGKVFPLALLVLALLPLRPPLLLVLAQWQVPVPLLVPVHVLVPLLVRLKRC